MLDLLSRFDHNEEVNSQHSVTAVFTLRVDVLERPL